LDRAVPTGRLLERTDLSNVGLISHLEEVMARTPPAWTWSRA
jgi:hypothetical protein